MKRMYLAVAVSLLLGASAPAHATPAQAIEVAGILETGCPLSDPSTVVAADGTKSEIKFTVTCNLAGQKLVTFEFKFDTNGTECTEPTLSHTSGTGAASRKVNIGATCKLDQTGRGGYDVKRTTTIDIAGLVMQTESTQRTSSLEHRAPP